MSTTPSTFYLVVYYMMLAAGSPPVIKSLLTERTAGYIVNAVPGTPARVDKKDAGDKYDIYLTNTFTYNNTDGSMTLFIVCQGKKIEK